MSIIEEQKKLENLEQIDYFQKSSQFDSDDLSEASELDF